MLTQLTPQQARVIGVMLEKERTTPDQYPLSLNALTAGCNQKSNREPVMALTETEVQDIVDELREKRLLNEQSGFGSRVVKYTHRFCNTEFGDLKFNRQQLALITVLLLRGPQTPGELRNRTNRLADFANVEDVETCLSDLLHYNHEPVVVKLEREPGKRECRYAHCFTPLDDMLVSSAGSPPEVVTRNEPQEERISVLEKEVAELKRQYQELTAKLADLLE